MVYSRFKSENVGDKHAKALQMMIDVLVDSRKVVDMQREKQAERLKQAEKHLSDMEHSRELIEKDLREAYESYKLGMTDKGTYREQRKTYEQMLERLQENIEKQMAAVTKMADVDVPEVAGLEMLEGQLKLTGLNREMVDAFVEEIVVYAKDRVEIKWKFNDEFWEVRKVEKIEYSVENMEMGWYNCTHESISLER